MAETFYIDQTTLVKCATWIREIRDAGCMLSLLRELRELRMDPELRDRERNLRWQRSLAMNEVDDLANVLVTALDCPRSQAVSAAADALGYLKKREAAIHLIRRMAQEVRRLQATGQLRRATA